MFCITSFPCDKATAKYLQKESSGKHFKLNSGGKKSPKENTDNILSIEDESKSNVIINKSIILDDLVEEEVDEVEIQEDSGAVSTPAVRWSGKDYNCICLP